MKDILATGTLVTADGYPGIWRVNQPVGSQGDVHLVPAGTESREYAAANNAVSLILFRQQVQPAPSISYRVHMLFPGYLFASGQDTWLPVSSPFARHTDALRWASNLGGTWRELPEDDE